jgi:hypothetical protein
MFDVTEHRERQVTFLGVGCHSDKRVLAIGVDAHELHALLCVLLVQGNQRRDVEVGNRALGVEEHDDIGLLVLESIQ